jgi:hypothetical protein
MARDLAVGQAGSSSSGPVIGKNGAELSLLDDVNVLQTGEIRRADLSSLAADHVAAASDP